MSTEEQKMYACHLCSLKVKLNRRQYIRFLKDCRCESGFPCALKELTEEQQTYYAQNNIKLTLYRAEELFSSDSEEDKL